jgi:membrane protein YqaA with SNARE-associated domain
LTFITEAIQNISNFAEQITSSQDFQSYGLLFLIVWSAIPSSITITEIVSIALLALGVSPIILIIISALGATLGDFILYLIGRGSYRIFKGKHKDQEDGGHLLHKYRLPIFIAVPFLMIIGDIIVIIAGYERIGFKKILPFILIGEFLRMTVGMLIIMNLIRLPEFFGI